MYELTFVHAQDIRSVACFGDFDGYLSSVRASVFLYRAKLEK